MLYRRRPFWRECWPLWVGECPMFQPCQEVPPWLPVISSQVANCHEEAQALREYLAEVRKLDPGNHPQSGNSSPNVARPGGNLECGPKLSKIGKLCHCFEHRAFWRIMFLFLNLYFSCIFLISFEIWRGLKHNQLLDYWDFPHGNWQSIGSNIFTLDSRWSEIQFGISLERFFLMTKVSCHLIKVDVTTWNIHRYTWSIAGVHSLCLLIIEIMVVLICWWATINLCVS